MKVKKIKEGIKKNLRTMNEELKVSRDNPYTEADLGEIGQMQQKARSEYDRMAVGDSLEIIIFPTGDNVDYFMGVEVFKWENGNSGYIVDLSNSKEELYDIAPEDYVNIAIAMHTAVMQGLITGDIDSVDPWNNWQDYYKNYNNVDTNLKLY